MAEIHFACQTFQRLGGFDGIQILALDVLDECDFEDAVIGIVLNDGRNVGRALRVWPREDGALLRSAQSGGLSATNQQRLNYPVCFYRVSKFLQACLDRISCAAAGDWVRYAQSGSEATRVPAGRGLRGAAGWRWAAGFVGSRAERPLPKALRCLSGVLFMGQDLLCQLNVALGSARADVIGDNRLTETGGFRQTDAARDHGFKDAFSKKLRRSCSTWRVRLVRSSYMVSKTPSTLDQRAERFANTINGVQELGDAFQSEELALDGDQDGIGGDHGVECQEIEGRRAIDQNEVIVVANRFQFLAEPGFAIFQLNQFQIGRDQVFVRGNDIESLEFGVEDGVG